MAEVKQGLNYEITANDKASAVADKAAKNVEKSASDASQKIKIGALEGAEGFNAISAASNLASGNLAGVGQEAAKLLPKFKNIGAAGSLAFAAIGGAILGVMKSLEAGRDLVKTWLNLGSAPEEIQNATASLSELKAQAEDFAEAMTRAKEEAERQCQIFEDELNALHQMTEAQNEFNRAQALALATTEKQRNEINRYYDDLNALNKYDADAASRLNKRVGLRDEESRLRAELAEANRRKNELLKTSQNMTKVAQKSKTGFWGSVWDEFVKDTTGKVQGNDKAMSALNAGTEASNKYFDELDKIEELQKKIEENLHKQKLADIEEETAQKKAATKVVQQIDKENQEQQKQQQDSAQKAKEDEQKLIETNKTKQIKANNEIMAARQKTLQEFTDLESQASARVAAAQSKVAEAWGWYRDKDKMAAQIKEEKAEAEAQKQFEKDFEKLKFRRDWRTAKDLSVDQEAVRRVALAKEEETAAQKALAETAKSTAQAAASLAEIEKVITQEG